jgi:hypothetical protein
MGGPKVGYEFDAQALGTSKERSSHKPTVSTAGKLDYLPLWRSYWSFWRYETGLIEP